MASISEEGRKIKLLVYGHVLSYPEKKDYLWKNLCINAIFKPNARGKVCEQICCTAHSIGIVNDIKPTEFIIAYV